MARVRLSFDASARNVRSSWGNGPSAFGALPIRKRRHVIHKELIEVIAGNDNQEIRPAAGHPLSHQFVIPRGLKDGRFWVGTRYLSREIRAVRDSHDLNEFCHFPVSLSQPVLGYWSAGGNKANALSELKI